MPVQPASANVPDTRKGIRTRPSAGGLRVERPASGGGWISEPFGFEATCDPCAAQRAAAGFREAREASTSSMFCKKGGSFDAGAGPMFEGVGTPAPARRPARAVHVPAVADVLHRPSTGWLVGALAYSFYEARGRRFSLGIRPLSLPASIYRSRSFAVDVQLLFNQLLAPARWLVGALSSRSSRSCATQLVTLFGERAGVEPGISTAALVVLMLPCTTSAPTDAPPVTRRAVPVVVPPGIIPRKR